MNDVKTSVDVAACQVLAVIPTLNEAAHIEACIRSLMQGDPNLRDVAVTIADGGSADATCEIVRRLQSEFSNLQLLHNPGKLQSAAINLAAEKHSSETTKFLVRCDAHSIYPENFILDVVQSLASIGSDSLVIPMDAIGSTCFEKANAWIVDTPLGSGGSAHRGGTKSGYVDHGHHAGFLLTSFQNVGGYDETFSHNEDAEYDQRVAASGGEIYLDASIRIQYSPRGNVKALAKQYFNYGKGRAKNIQKHGQSLKPRQALPIVALLANIGGLFLGMLFWAFFIAPLSYLIILVISSLWVIVQRKSLCGVWSGVALGAMHMSWAIGFLSQQIRRT